MKNWLEMILRAPADEAGAGAEADTPTETGTEAVLTGGAAEKTETAAEAGTKEQGTAGAVTEEKPEPTPEEKAEAEKKAAAEAKLNAVPGDGEAYDFTAPEGMEVDAVLAEKAQPVLKELGLTQAQANKLAGLMAEVRAAEGDAIAASYVKAQQDYVKAAKADPEIGQTNWDTSVKQANAALQKFGTPALVAALSEHGIQNHPEMIRFAARIGLHTADDVADPGTHVDTTNVPPEERWYGKTTATTKK